MNYDQHLTDLITYLSMDKALPLPYRNYVVADAKRLHALIRGTMTMSLAQPPTDDPLLVPACICPDGGRRIDCPVAHKGV